MVLSVFPVDADSPTASASISVSILPAQSLEGQISVTPKRVALTRGGHGKLVVTNHSGSTHTISVEVEPTVYSACRLTYTPKQITLADGEFQVFRLFYVTEDSRNCRTTFRLNIHYLDNDEESVDVYCE